MANFVTALTGASSAVRNIGSIIGSIGEGNTPLVTQAQSLYAEGGDAQANLFDLAIQYPTVLNIPDPLTLQTDSIRVDGFTPPQFKMETYMNRYLTGGATLVKPQIEGDRFFSLEFRIDAFYQVYKRFVIWRNAFFSPETGLVDYTRFNDPQFLGTVTVSAASAPLHQFGGSDTSQRTRWQDDSQGVSDGIITSNDTSTLTALLGGGPAPLTWVFFNVGIVGIEPVAFKTGEADSPQKIKIDFIFQDFDTPEYDLDDNIQTEQQAQSGLGVAGGTF